MFRAYRRKTAIRTQAEHGLGVRAVMRPEPDVELIARIIVGPRTR